MAIPFSLFPAPTVRFAELHANLIVIRVVLRGDFQFDDGFWILLLANQNSADCQGGVRIARLMLFEISPEA